MNKGCSARGLLMLGLGLILLVVVGLLFYGQSARSSAPRPMAGLAGFGSTARQSFAPAAELAAQWQADAGLASVSRHWPEAGGQLSGEGEWAFQFFSPSTSRLALVTVTGETASMTRESASPYSVPTFSAAEWQVDSDQALQAWWERGGSTLLARRPGADLVMQLRVPEGGGNRPVWTVAGFVAGTEIVISVAVDGTDGTMVEQ
ncbi:MAG: hypothetical protein DRJ03_24135 [Chloroflexi bacterium]|nr:MAG: hypothetical protein B6I35_01260 [Anaerolineaceae bacterium 4572_32.2]RLC79085.1 MAG: hypothetical protein DRJ03_24135 [Chloroflexota bacterium]RLC82053.1 MAG: hypothetical protein DRI81_00905 [Chloroflexota bacterium]HEY72458.1 hypothetical protein [Thermoflexia bacterium]